MLQITLPAVEQWDERNEEFVCAEELTLQLEHSLASLSKWESKWRKPFLHTTEMTYEESIDYVRCMTLTQNVSPETYYRITHSHLDEIRDYISDPMTATTFSEPSNGKRNRDIITSEIIYYWMTASQIPFECQYWHLNKLLTLVRVCSIKNGPQKKVGRKETASQYAAMNAARKRMLNTKG